MTDETRMAVTVLEVIGCFAILAAFALGSGWAFGNLLAGLFQ